ncbi:MAG: sigma-70 family RNA polymerase sigma factor [Deltaproteobacteria bacterium]|nr:sigma-70 family RNA polymerase sigma factor [Deltaproteobacteria bacterium]
MPVYSLVGVKGLEQVAVKAGRIEKASRAEKVVELSLSKQKQKNKQLSASDREKLVLDFRLKARKLARSILRKWHARLDLMEVDSLVDLSLCEAVRRYDVNKGASFMTFMFYHLRGNLIRAVSTAASLNVVPVMEGEDGACERRKRSKGNRGISAIEVAEALSSHDNVLPDEALFKKELVMLSSNACAKLDALEREVIYRIYVQEQQLIDIAHSLGYSRCHISRVKRKALDTLCHDLAPSMDGDFGKELSEARKRLNSQGELKERRSVHRRKPRSRKAQEERERRLLEQLPRAA